MESERRRQLLLFGGLIAANFALDAVSLPALVLADQWLKAANAESIFNGCHVIWSRPLEEFLLCGFASQITMLAIGTALLGGSNLIRLLLGTIALVVDLYLIAAIASFLPFSKTYFDYDWRAITNIDHLVSMLPIFFLMQFPFWLPRAVSGLRVCRTWAEAQEITPWRFSIQDLLGVTAYVAATLASFSVIAPKDGGDNFVRDLVLSIALSCSFFGMAYLWPGLGNQRWYPRLIAGLPLTFLFAFTSGMAIIENHMPYFQTSRTDSLRICGAVTGMLVVALGNGLVLRRAGYRVTGNWSGQGANDGGGQEGGGPEAQPLSG